ncbi:MAG: hypothetical protein KQI78_04245 [Deltaproteobacteria bacterium]|nr:hypothetical protein [Deltaproteobacteria bacterium]
MRKLIVVAMIFALCSCAGANISSQVRESGEPGSSMMLRCFDYMTGNEALVNSMLKQYDGWKLVYVSEYTTDNKTTTSCVMCFEKPYVE